MCVTGFRSGFLIGRADLLLFTPNPYNMSLVTTSKQIYTHHTHTHTHTHTHIYIYIYIYIYIDTHIHTYMSRIKHFLYHQ